MDEVKSLNKSVKTVDLNNMLVGPFIMCTYNTWVHVLCVTDLKKYIEITVFTPIEGLGCNKWSDVETNGEKVHIVCTFSHSHTFTLMVPSSHARQTLFEIQSLAGPVRGSAH